MSDRKEAWHVGREIPLALIFTIAFFFVGQTSSIIWWASQTSTRLDTVEHSVALIVPLNERTVRLEEKIAALQQGVAELKTLMLRQAPEATGPRR
jgi:hypothetical protein